MAGQSKRTLTSNLVPGEVEEFEFSGAHVLHECLSGGRSSGVERLSITRDAMTVHWLLTRGLSLEAVELNGQRFGWDSPVRGPVHPQWVPLMEPSGLGWLDGFDELMVRCGLSSNGAPEFDEHFRLKYPLHGRIANLPSQDLELSWDDVREEIVLQGTVYETRFHFQKWKLSAEYRIDWNNHRIQLSDTVTNLAGSARDFQLMYHYNLGAPLLEPGGRIWLAATTIAPRDWHSASQINRWSEIYQWPAGDPEQVFFVKPQCEANGNSLAVLTNSDSSSAAAVRFSGQELPCFSLWKNLGAHEDGFVIGLEPATNFPNVRSFESQHQRTVWLPAGENWRSQVEFRFAVSPTETASLVAQVERIQAGRKTSLSPEPDPRWSASKS